MTNRVFTFMSPTSSDETADIISKVVARLGGKISVKGNVIVAKLRSNRYLTIFPRKFTFYIGAEAVRVVTTDSAGSYPKIRWEHRCRGTALIWDDFIMALTQMFPQYNFGITAGSIHIVSAKIVSDGTTQLFNSHGVAFGGMLLSSGEVRTSFSKEVLASVRYSNGMVLDGEISKQSNVYNRIMVDLDRLNTQT